MVKITWIAHSCFRINTADKVIYTDPYQIKGGDPADIILVSHDHYDHADKGSIKEIYVENKTKLICPKTSVGKLKKFDPIGLDPNESIDVEDIKILAVPAYNPNKAFHPKGNKWVGFVIETEGKRIYHAGDTDVIPEMKELGELDVALIPVGDTYTMGFSEAVEACGIIKPKICVPMHDWDKDLTEFSKMVSKDVPFVEVQILKEKDLEI
ncbi:MAG: MBL fold metallo-hydrolase [Candidatus Helarchaeota archaeon]